MGFPSEGREGAFRNPMPEVVRYGGSGGGARGLDKTAGWIGPLLGEGS